jgi:serine/threonine protein kinase
VQKNAENLPAQPTFEKKRITMSFPLKNGEVLRGRYQVRERIGQGGMGSIYLAEDLRLSGRLCAL